MKFNHYFFLISFFLLGSVSINGQYIEDYKILLTVSNIPKIEKKVPIGKNGYKIDKSATLIYKFKHQAKLQTLKYDTLKKKSF